MTKTINNTDYRIKTDSPRIRVDTWDGPAAWAFLKPGDEYVDETYKGSEFVSDDEIHLGRMPINVRITGYTIHNIAFAELAEFARCEIEFVRDGEPSVTTHGFVELERISS